jgi:hypothetical protein
MPRHLAFGPRAGEVRCRNRRFACARADRFDGADRLAPTPPRLDDVLRIKGVNMVSERADYAFRLR